ncbi:MAG: protein kinase [Gammaproteobacteria bacterium]|nr:protein kinase [Gammaproteobacteria bacterium]
MTDSDETQIAGVNTPGEMADPDATAIGQPPSEVEGGKVINGNPNADATVVATQQQDSSIPKKLGKYEIEGVLGEGAMGVVYKAKDPFIERTVAIKTIRNDLLDPNIRDEMLARFKREAQAAGQLSHPGIVSVYEYGEEANTAFISMEFIQGEELADIFERGEKPKEEHVIGIIIQLLEALSFAHEKGIVHRDIKPSNIIVTADRKVKLADFGIAHVDTSSLTQSGSVLGTPAFMSPEQCVGSSVDSRTDLFSVGAVLYYTLTGEKPFPGGNPFTIMQRVINHEPEPPSSFNPMLPKELDKILARAMAKKPEKRYQTAQEFIDALKTVESAGTGTSATMVSPAVSVNSSRSSSAGKIVGMLVALAIAGGAGAYFFTDLLKPQPPEVSEQPPVETAPVITPRPPTEFVATAPEPEPKPELVPELEITPLPIVEAEPETVAITPAAVVEKEEELPFTIIPSRDDKVAAIKKDIDQILEMPEEPPAIQLGLSTSRGSSPEFSVGELLQVSISSDTSSHLYCFHQDSAGVVMRVLPNRFTPANRINPASKLSIPSTSDEFDIVMENAGTTETLACIASSSVLSNNLKSLAYEDLAPMSMSLAEIERELHENAAESYGIAKMSIRIRP